MSFESEGELLFSRKIQNDEVSALIYAKLLEVAHLEVSL